MSEYNKAIRDKIPEIIKNSGYDCNTKKLSDEEFLVELEKKLNEEVSEYLQSKSPEELADILEVIYRISELKGVRKENLEDIRLKIESERGGFYENLFLINTSKQEKN